MLKATLASVFCREFETQQIHANVDLNFEIASLAQNLNRLTMNVRISYSQMGQFEVACVCRGCP